MKKQEFIEQVKRQCPPELLPFVERGIDIVGKLLGRNGEYQNYEVTSAIQFIGRLAPQLASKEDGMEAARIELTAQDLITSDFLADKITPWVEMVRLEIFGSPGPPFISLMESEQWIKGEEQKQPPLEQYINWDEYKETVHHSIKVPKAFESPSPLHLSLSYHRPMEYLGSDGKRHRVSITEPAPQHWFLRGMRESAQKFTPLNWLDNETRVMKRATGFNQPSLVQFILIGIPPILPRYNMTGRVEYQPLPTGTGEEMCTTHINLEIWARDLTFEELREIYSNHRSMLGLTRGKKLTQEHWEIYKLVQKKGGPSKARVVGTFWESVRNEWNNLHPEKKYETRKGVQMIYNRITDTLTRRLQGERIIDKLDEELTNKRRQGGIE